MGWRAVGHNWSVVETNASSNDSSAPVAIHSLPHLLVTAIILGLIILSTVVGNVFVIAAVTLERNLRCVNNYLVASLAFADLMVASLVMPLAAVKEVTTRWFMGSEVCNIHVSISIRC